MAEQAATAAASSAPAPGPIAAAVSAGAPLTMEQGKAVLRESRATNGATGARPDAARTDARRPGSDANPISDAARTLGQRAREARQERQTEQARQTEEAPLEGQEQSGQDELSQTGETLDDSTAENGHQHEAGTDATGGESGEGQTIELDDGVSVSLDEVRDSFMFKADHTRKTQALSTDRKAFEADRAQRIHVLNLSIDAVSQMLPAFKPVNVLMDELGDGPGIREFHRQEGLRQQIGALQQVRQQEQSHHDKQLRESAIKTLSEKHGDKAAAHYDAAVDIAHQVLGMPKEYLSTMMAHPEIVQMAHDAKSWRDLQGKSGNVRRTIADKPRVMKPGARVSQQAAGQRELTNAHARLKSSGNLADAVALLRTIRTKGRAG